MIPVTCLVSSRRNEGANGANVTVDVALPLVVVTTTGTLPVVASSGACRLICPGLTYHRYAGLPLMVTLVPPRDVGKLPVQVAEAPARLDRKSTRLKSSHLGISYA